MFSFPHLAPLRMFRFIAGALGVFSLYLLVLAPSVFAQSAPGFQAPEKPSTTLEVPIQIRAGRGEAPLSRIYDYLKVDPAKVRRLPALTADEMRMEPSEKILRIGVVRPLLSLINPLTASPPYRLIEGDVRVMGIVSQGALYTRVHFSRMSLPPGARVFVYSTKNPDDFNGPYEGHGLAEDGTFWTPPLAGEEVVIEYFTRSGSGATSEVPFSVSEISHTFKDVFGPDAAGLCNLEVTPEWANVAKSVGMLQFVVGAFEAVCTGTLLNDQANDQAPYLLTANHCFSAQTEAQTLRVYWNYNTGDDPPGGTPFTDGANLLATGASSDFTFVRLIGSLPGGLVFSGWDAAATPLSTSVTGIHHPEGSHKRISFGTTNPNCTGDLPGPCANFTHVGWSSGVTEPGSSGSGIWKGSAANAQLVGTLTGGFSSCSSPTANDEYGSFSATYPNVSFFLTATDCVTGVTATNQTFSNGVGSGSISVTAPNGCNWTASSTAASWLFITSGGSGSGNGTVNFGVNANNGPQRSGTIVIGQKVIVVTQAAGPACIPEPIAVGQTVNSSLHLGSCPLGDGSFFKPYSFSGLAGQQVSVLMTSSAFDTYLFLLHPDGSIFADDDDGAGGSNSRIPPGSGLITLPTTGTYAILANSFSPGATGSFSLTLDGPAVADLSVSNTTTNNRVAPGSKVVYLVTVTNNAGTAANSISVTDNLPSEVTFFSCGATDGACGGSGNNRTITFPSLAVGASATGVLIATVNNSVAVDSVISNTATVSSSTPDTNSSNNSSTAVVDVKSTQLTPRANGRIAFGSDRSGQGTGSTGSYTINPNGTGEVLFSSLDPFASSPAWSPDGTRMAFGKRTSAGTYADEIRVVNPDGTNSLTVASNVFDTNHKIAWAPNGTKLAFIGTGRAIFVVNADGTGLTKLPNPPANINDLAWSPDGSKFAYSNGTDVFVMNTDGTAQTNLTHGPILVQGEPGACLLPRWSPDGTRLLFSGEASNFRNVFVINADGSGIAPLITLHQSVAPAWSPDGQKVTFVTLNELYVANSDGTGPIQITNNHGYNIRPDWQSLDALPPSVQLSAAAYPVMEGTPGVTVTVTRTGFTSGATSVDYATSDLAGANNCNVVNGSASSRCDYLTTIGTLNFAASETSKTVTIPVVDDAYAEGGETLTFTLSNASGGTLAAPAVATITINDNDAANGTNPIDTASFFVRQHYIDFLNREPDDAGLAFWTNQITECQQPGATCSAEVRRINVSAAFFLSIEFQETGYLVYRTYRAAYGNLNGKPVPLTFNEFLPDTQQIGSGVQVGVGDWQAKLEANKVAYLLSFVGRARFVTAYPLTMTPTQFVDGLFATAGVTPSANDRDAAINEFGGVGTTADTAARGRALRRVAENSILNQQEKNKAFVLMQYFGYLRRNPNDPPEMNLDFGGYNFWLGKLNQFNGNFVDAEMVKAFIVSGEYRQRFGP
ncbi:MAG: Calx-beta domain-containing protein [Pyrinomonadaceae bacterium]